jgi:hypothetical protein
VTPYVNDIPPEVIDAKERDHPELTSIFTTCAYATAMGYVDLCVAAFTISPARQLLTPHISLYAEPLYLISPKKKQKTGIWVSLTKAFLPFQL